ncbi:MAG TPA: LexA family transcriptional regulator [Flavobacteriaceae bacterium]|nr:LexA family transcriptional regulator [Flavobacteriaceae bacterium]
MQSKLPIEIQRFKEIRESNHFTQSEFAEKLGIKNTTADIERGKTKLSGKIVTELLKLFGINPLWLFGESSMKFLETTKTAVLPKVVSINSSGSENILLVNQKAAAGYPQNIQDVDWHKQLPAFDIPLPQYRNATYRGFQIEGDSMTPNFQPGEWVLGKAVSDLSDISFNKIYVVVLLDSVLIKQLWKHDDSSKVRLISFNKEYAPLTVEKNEIQELWQINSKLTFSINTQSDNNILRQLQESMEDLKNQFQSIKNQKKPLLQ